MSLLPPVIAELRADIHQFTAKMGEARAEMGGVEGAAAKTGLATKAMAAGVVLAGADIAFHAVKLADDFQANMRLIHTQAMAFNEDIGKMSSAVLTMAGQVGVAPVELAKGLYHIESAGFRGATALDMLRMSAEGSRVGLADMEGVTQGMIAMMAAHIKGVTTANEAMGWLNATVGTGDMRMEDFAKSLQNGIIPVFANAGLGAKDFAAAVATITDNATKPQVATTHLLHTVAMMEAPTKKAQEALKGLGMTQFELASDMRGPGGLGAAVHDLQKHLSKLNPNQQNAALSAIFGGGKSFGTIQELERELGRLDDKYKVGGTAVKDFAKSWSETQKTFKQTNAEFTASLEAGMIRVGTLLLPVVTKLEHGLMTLAHWIQHHKVAWAALAGIGVLLAGALVEMAYGVLEAAAPFIAAAAAAAALGAGLYELYKHSPKFRHMCDQMKQAVVQTFTTIGGWLHQLSGWWQQHRAQIEHVALVVANVVVNGIGAAVHAMASVVRALLNGLSAWWKLHGAEVSATVHNMWVVIKAVLDVLVATWKRVWPYLAIILKTAWNLVVDVVKTAVKIIGDTIAIWMDVFSGHWSKLWRDVKKWVVDGFSLIVKVFKDFASGAGQLLLQAGKDIIQGLINGLKSMGGAAKDAAKGVWDGIKSSAMGFFKMGSPSKLMFEMGGWVGQGFANGIAGSVPAVLAAAKMMHLAAYTPPSSSAAFGLGITGTLVSGTSLTAMAPKQLMANVATTTAKAAAAHTASVAHAATTHHTAHHPAHHAAKHHTTKHHASHPTEYVFDITLMVDGEKLWRVMQKETLKHEKRHGSNGLSAKKK